MPPPPLPRPDSHRHPIFERFEFQTREGVVCTIGILRQNDGARCFPDIGSGAWGKVQVGINLNEYVGSDAARGYVAVKTITFAADDSPRTKRLLSNEIAALRLLNSPRPTMPAAVAGHFGQPSQPQIGHPNVNGYFGYHNPNANQQQINGEHRILLEPVPGGTLRKFLEWYRRPGGGQRSDYAQRGPDFNLFRSLLIQLCKGMQYIHRHHIAHRDLKAQNVMITPDHQIKIIDFGLATIKRQDHEFFLSDDFYHAGSGAYRAPEVGMWRGDSGSERVQVHHKHNARQRGGWYDPRAIDCYAVGFLACEFAAAVFFKDDLYHSVYRLLSHSHETHILHNVDKNEKSREHVFQVFTNPHIQVDRFNMINNPIPADWRALIRGLLDVDPVGAKIISHRFLGTIFYKFLAKIHRIN